jgi:hypothetical protein
MSGGKRGDGAVAGPVARRDLLRRLAAWNSRSGMIPRGDTVTQASSDGLDEREREWRMDSSAAPTEPRGVGSEEPRIRARLRVSRNLREMLASGPLDQNPTAGRK